MGDSRFNNMGNSQVNVNTSDKNIDSSQIVREAINTFANYLPTTIGQSVRWAVGISTIFILAVSITANVLLYKELITHNDMIANIETKVENVNKRHYELRDMIKDFTSNKANKGLEE